MGFIKPSISKTRSPTDPRQQNGRVINPPTYLELGGLKGPGKVTKNSMKVEKPERGGPFVKGS